jgi:hypothetical protein
MCPDCKDINRKLEEAVEILAENYTKPVTDISLAKYKNLIEEYKNKHVLEYITKQYRPTNIEVGTFGAYLWGCSQNYYGNVNKSCSALCAGSFNLDDDSQTCQYQIWTYDKELKLKTPHISSTRAYIYVPEDWTGFKKSDMDYLKDIDFVSVLTTKESKHITLIPMTAIENLPISEKVEEIKETSSNYYYYIFFLLFILLILFFLKFDLQKHFLSYFK